MTTRLGMKFSSIYSVIPAMVRTCTQSRSYGITVNSSGMYPFTVCLRDKADYLPKKYLAINQSLSPIDAVDLGASIAENYGKAIGPVERKMCTYSTNSLINLLTAE
jgi:hypothetical protein